MHLLSYPVSYTHLVLVLMEGWGTAGKGSVIGQVIQNIDPRFFKVESMGEKLSLIHI